MMELNFWIDPESCVVLETFGSTEDVLGATKSQVVGRSVLSWFEASQRDDVLRLFSTLLRNEKPGRSWPLAWKVARPVTPIKDPRSSISAVFQYVELRPGKGVIKMTARYGVADDKYDSESRKAG